MAWITLFYAGLFEIVWATAMKQSAGFTRPRQSRHRQKPEKATGHLSVSR